MDVFISLLYIAFKTKGYILERTNDFYNWINSDIIINSSDYCTSIQIPESDWYKCCSMKIRFKDEDAYNCFALEIEYTKNKTIFDEYINIRSMASAFGMSGGQIEIDCGNNLTNEKNYKTFSNEF